MIDQTIDQGRIVDMAQGTEQTAAQLEKVTARLEQLARRQRGGPVGGLKPFLLGALAGAALLYAPRAGEQSRTLLRRNATELQERATQSAQSAKGKIQERTGAARETVQETLTQAASVAQETKQAATEGGKAAQTAAAPPTPKAAAQREGQESKAGDPKPS